MNDKIKIELLADHPELISILKIWFEQEWAPYYGPGGPGNAERDLVESCSRNKLPVAFIAFINGKVCGTAALKKESITTHKHLTPWLAALLVDKKFRRRGIAEQLIAAVEESARRFGFLCLYVGTGEGSGTPVTPLRKRGWKFVEKKPYFDSEVAIYKKVL